MDHTTDNILIKMHPHRTLSVASGNTEFVAQVQYCTGPLKYSPLRPGWSLTNTEVCTQGDVGRQTREENMRLMLMLHRYLLCTWGVIHGRPFLSVPSFPNPTVNSLPWIFIQPPLPCSLSELTILPPKPTPKLHVFGNDRIVSLVYRVN